MLLHSLKKALLGSQIQVLINNNDRQNLLQAIFSLCQVFYTHHLINVYTFPYNPMNG